ncbi:MAG TPA: nucleotidyl transferase AbiEii/AbiGii toxin family protein, partial [Candidatus Krumholzibacteria bacterium]|nr:nucleotidyl transferase AbiEii/AbiGii toxin family protein [Candidatus Krumholzibacteria bacterium]
MLTEQELMREAADSGFQREPFEKVMRLAELLESLRSHPYLKSRLVLKGGTALNLFVFDVPRLSVDVDLNYIGASDQETMVAERPKLEQAIQAVCGRLGVQVKRVPPDHAGGKWRLSYRTVSGRPAMLELDLNFMMRTPLWAPRVVDSHQLGLISARQIPVLDLHELAAGKLAALFARNASRDLFDVHQLLQRDDLDHSRLRFGFLVYGGINRRDWRELSIEDVAADSREVHQQLIPMLRSHAAPKEADLEAWTRRLVSECRDLLSAVLPLDPHEIEFLDRLNDRGEIVPELLTPLEDRQKIVRSHPGLLWKALNVRRHR